MTSDYPAAVAWDMDGTLVDSEPYWMQAEVELIAQYGATWTHEDALGMVGAGLWVSARALRERGVDLTEDEIVSRLTDRVQEQLAQNVPWRPGARELLIELRAAKIPTALVTMSVRRMAQQVVDSLDFDAFDLLVTGDEVTHPKPHPEAYTRAAELLDVDPRFTVAIEDSRAGLASASGAGCVAVGVPHIIELPPSDDYVVWPTLSGRSIADLGDLVNNRRAALAEDGARP